MNELIQSNEVPEHERAIQFAKRGVQWFAKRVLQYILQYFYNISVPCFSSLLSKNKGILLVFGNFVLATGFAFIGRVAAAEMWFLLLECDREVPLFGVTE